MGKIIMMWSVLLTLLSMAENIKTNCLTCHSIHQIPNTLIYKRYLMKYSTSKEIKHAMFKYLKSPTKKSSIMPAQFFLKFPMKEKLRMDERTLYQSIEQFIQRFDIKKKLVLDKNSH